VKETLGPANALDGYVTLEHVRLKYDCNSRCWRELDMNALLQRKHTTGQLAAANEHLVQATIEMEKQSGGGSTARAYIRLQGTLAA
jgi:hypothetical protein